VAAQNAGIFTVFFGRIFLEKIKIDPPSAFRVRGEQFSGFGVSTGKASKAGLSSISANQLANWGDSRETG
jgi:hypothetical protein